jgi:hypothetical protein
MASRGMVGVYLFYLTSKLQNCTPVNEIVGGQAYIYAQICPHYMGTSKKLPAFGSSEKDNHILLRLKEI